MTKNVFIKKCALVALCVISTFMVTAQTGEIVGIPTTGAMGVAVSVEDLQAKSNNADLHPKPKRTTEEWDAERHPHINPLAPKAATWPLGSSNGTTINGDAARATTATQTIHSNFLSTNLATDFLGFLVPPDGNGDVGTTQICIAANGRIKFYNRNTVCATAQTTTTASSSTNLAAPILNVDADAFFTPVTANGISDPHVRFDRLSGRWFIVAIDLAGSSNKCVIAVSSSATIVNSASFTFFSFVFDALLPVPASPYAGGFFDYPTLGIDANALYIGGRMFNAAGTAYTGASIFVVRKSSILAAGPIVTTAFHQIGTASTGIYTPQGVHNDDPTATVGYVIGVDQGVFSQLDIHRISNPGGTPTASAVITLTVPTTSTPLNPVAGGDAQSLDANDDRLFAAMITKVNGVSSLWTSHAIAVTTAGTGANSGANRRNGARFYQIGNLATTPTLTQSGILFDAAAATPRFYWFPSIATSGQGHSVLGASTCATNQSVNVAVAGRYRTDVLGTIQAATLATASTSTYAPPSDPGPARRWGDYSQTVVDPNDNMTMWTFQEYTNNTNSWGIRAVQLKAPPPATPTALGTLVCGTTASTNFQNAVTLNGTSTNNSEFYDPGTGYTNRLSVTTTGTGASINNIVFVSATQITFNIVWPPALGGSTQTLTITNPDCQSVTTTYTLATGCVLIPVKWISFTGKENNKKVDLNWVTTNESNNKYFSIEKSVDGATNFVEIGRANSKSVNGATYDFTDLNPSAINYYRLKQVDLNGAITYSDIVLVKVFGKNSFLAYPNPTKNELHIDYNERFKGGSLLLIDNNGAKVASKILTDVSSIKLDVSTFAEGVYMVKIISLTGEQRQQKIIIQRP
jgi:Secretion system C-terminal sorting domain